MREITEIIIHCSATPEGKDFTAADIDRWHKERGFKKIGYHYVIKLDGTIELGRPIDEVGAHCSGHNQGSVGVCYIGGIGTSLGPTLPEGRVGPLDTRTPKQKESMRLLIGVLLRMFPKATLHGHNEFAKKACPCFDVKSELSQLYASLK